MSKVTIRILEVILGLALLFLFAASAFAQEQPLPSEAGQISPNLRSVAYPEAIYPHGIMPDWDRGYVMHHEIEWNHSPDIPMAVMYDATGKRIREGKIWPQGAGSVHVRRTAASRDGAILAAGGAIMLDGSIQGYIVKTDLVGTTVQTLVTGSFMPEQICEAPDGTIWSLGKSEPPNDGAQHDNSVLRHYGFGKGQLHTFLPEDTVAAPVRSAKPWFVPWGSHVRCGKNKVSIYLNFTNEYAEINTSSFELKRWKLDGAVVQQRDASGLAVTDDGKVYASFKANGIRGMEQIRGLYQIRAIPGNPIAELLPVSGTLNTNERGKIPPPGTFTMLWGADGNQLVVWRIEGNGEFLSWVNVTRSDSTD
jgi:hypothetical protein